MKQLLRVVLVKILQCEEQREFWKLENKIPTQEQLVAALRMNTAREKKGGKNGYVGQGKMGGDISIRRLSQKQIVFYDNYQGFLISP